MDYVFAGLSVLAAGFLFRSEWIGVAASKKAARLWIVLRVVALLAMLVFGFEATALFGAENSGAAFARVAAVLWLPQLVVNLVFGYKPASDKSGQLQH